MTALDCFEQGLLATVGRPTPLRPFVCDGSPLECMAFLVGTNPATSSSSDFWDFWKPGFGFDKAIWFEHYKEERLRRPLRPGKTRRNSVSNTRRVIEWILEEAQPAKCIETNVYAAPSEEIALLGSEERLTAPFDFLLEAIKPRVIVAHGADAERHLLAKRLSVPVLTVPHFARGWSQERARELGAKIKATCLG